MRQCALRPPPARSTICLPVRWPQLHQGWELHLARILLLPSYADRLWAFDRAGAPLRGWIMVQLGGGTFRTQRPRAAPGCSTSAASPAAPHCCPAHSQHCWFGAARCICAHQAAAAVAGRLASMATSSGDVPKAPALGDALDAIAEEPLPHLFARSNHAAAYQRIDDLRREVEASRIASHADEFEEETADDVVMIASVALEDVKAEEGRLAAVSHERRQLEEARQRRLDEDLAHRTQRAKDELAQTIRNRRGELASLRQRALHSNRLEHDRMQKAFRRAESHLLEALKQRKGEVESHYGNLMLVDGFFTGNRARRWKVDWDETPQPLEIKLLTLRGTRAKLPGGRYVMSVSLYDRLGGNLMRWSRLRGQEWNGATMPQEYEGGFSAMELPLNQSVFTVAPPRVKISPAMVLVFELFLLSGDASPTDRVVAWSAFPLVDTEFNVISGPFKTPLKRGMMDVSIDKHSELQRLFCGSLDHWLGNLYFEVRKLPRYTNGQKEFEVELQHTSHLLGFPERVAEDDDSTTADQALPGSARKSTDLERGHLSQLGPFASARLPNTVVATSSVLRSPRTNRKSSQITPVTFEAQHAEDEENDEEEASDDDSASGPERTTVQVEPGLSYHVYKTSTEEMYQRKAYTMLPKSRRSQRRDKRPRSLEEQLGKHSMAVKPPFSTELENDQLRRLQYVWGSLVAELGPRQWRTREYWFSMLCFGIIFWLRMFVHYGAQYFFLRAISVPVARFDFLAVSVALNYQSSLMLTREELGVVCIGPLFCILVFAILVLLSAATQRLLHQFPDRISRFIGVWGLQTVFNPVFILLTDLVYRRWRYQDAQEAIGDAFKLYWHFDRIDDTGLPGIFLTLFLYAVLMTLAAALFYIYLVRWHMQGKMLDVYQRLTGEEENFFMPYDQELSIKELSYVVHKAEQWRGAHGERRKTAVYDYCWEEEVYPDNSPASIDKETTTHISIHTLHLDGTRELYRHFLRLPDGAIIEVFGDLATNEPRLQRKVQLTLQRSHIDLGKLLDRSTSFVNDSLDGEGSLRRGVVSRYASVHCVLLQITYPMAPDNRSAEAVPSLSPADGDPAFSWRAAGSLQCSPPILCISRLSHGLSRSRKKKPAVLAPDYILESIGSLG
eukprot:m.228450 g.228450  ORF g.228450 m.228450 type:complete len:1127 (+) comp10856_c0_seq18:6377-9757(+)